MRENINLAKTTKFGIRDGLAILVILAVAVLFGLNIFTVLTNAKQSYQVLAAEQAGLDQLSDERNMLEKELAYYRSYDYTQLYARDELNLVNPGQKLYKIEGDQQFYEVVSRQRQIVKQQEFIDWWELILIPKLNLN